MVTSVKMTTAVITDALKAKKNEVIAERAATTAKLKTEITGQKARAQKLALAFGKTGSAVAQAKLNGALSTLNSTERSLERATDPRYIDGGSRYDSAIKAVSMSADETLRVSINSDLGRLLGL